MNGKEFLDVAQCLAKETHSEAFMRSAVSRAYYAAHNFGRHVLRQLGFGHIADGGRHGPVWEYFQNCGDPQLSQAGRALADLHGWRRGADYDLHKPEFGSANQAALSINSARLIVSQLGNCNNPGVSGRVKRGMKLYEHRILRPGSSP